MKIHFTEPRWANTKTDEDFNFYKHAKVDLKTMRTAPFLEPLPYYKIIKPKEDLFFKSYDYLRSIRDSYQHLKIFLEKYGYIIKPMKVLNNLYENELDIYKSEVSYLL